MINKVKDYANSISEWAKDNMEAAVMGIYSIFMVVILGESLKVFHKWNRAMDAIVDIRDILGKK